ncbi:YdcF family protein [Nocardia blacklockiae]|uniref:YdcF family protein n=1 Tax=Nocardia blacklockiae TaxID=480036 RepID=UPI00189505A6|nr:YdcF family protein [Nocardia blacklockiae]MBF6175858.1 YdcF family protein [Nocardia blacklockiae]
MCLAAAVGVAEFLSWRASRQYLAQGGKSVPGATEAVVVLGYPSERDGSTHPLQRWRCRIAVRSMDPGAESTLVFTGGAVARDWPEAEVMARYTRDVLGVPAARIRTETAAESTWQNIEFTIPLLEHADRVKIASDPMHAARARRYLRSQRPDLAARLAPAADYRFGEQWWLKLPTAAHELAAIARRRAGALAGRLWEYVRA